MVLAQLGWVAQAAVAVVRVRGRAARLLLGMIAASAAIAGVTLVALLRFEGPLVDWVLHHVLRDAWVAVARVLLDRFLAPRLFELVVNATAALSLNLMSLALFVPRERASTAFEVDRALLAEPPRASPLRHDLADLATTLLAIVTAQLAVFAIGYPPDPSRRALAHALSYLVLFAATALDFVPPLLARHGVHGSAAYLALLRRPLAALGFGACFSLPVVLVGALAPGSPLVRLALVVGTGALVIAWATIGGTRLAARVLTDGRGVPAASRPVRAAAWVALLAAFAGQAYAYGAVAVSLAGKTQLLKCRYHVEDGSFSVDLPVLGALLQKRVATTLRLTLEIENPTAHDVSVEDGRLEVRYGGARLAEVAVPPFAVASGAHARVPLAVPITVDLATARGLLHAGARELDATLYVQVARGFELPVYLLHRGD